MSVFRSENAITHEEIKRFPIQFDRGSALGEHQHSHGEAQLKD
jgi:hypothetical protein